MLLSGATKVNTVKMEHQSCDSLLCSLCFCFKTDSPKTTEMCEKIEKYLHIKMKYSWNGICLNCNTSLEVFHEFYMKVHNAQRSLHEKLMIQSQEDSEELKENCENRNEESDLIKTFNPDPSECKQTDSVQCAEECVGTDLSPEQEISKSIDDKYNQTKPKSKLSQKLNEISSDVEKKMLSFYNIKCEKCEDCKFTSFKMLGKHYKTVHNTQGYIKCCKRNIRVNDKYYLRNHMFKHLQPESCRCRVCGKELSSLVTLKNHMNLHKPEEERPFQCPHCNKRFCCKNDLKNHEKAIHVPANERQDFICDVCGKVFQKVATLKYHLSTVHFQGRKYICEICAKCFMTQSGLRTHINAAHSTLKPIQCHKCQKWLKTKDTFQKHLQLHQNNSYPCSHCDKICNSSTSLRSHLVKHSDERRYLCTVCCKSFKTKTHLKNHSAQHDAGISYKCPFCPKFFVNMSNYYTHKRRMHSTEKALG